MFYYFVKSYRYLLLIAGPYPDVDVVLSILLQYNIPAGNTGKTYSNQQAVGGSGPSTSDLSGSSKTRLNSSLRYPRGHSATKKDIDSMLAISH